MAGSGWMRIPAPEMLTPVLEAVTYLRTEIPKASTEEIAAALRIPAWKVEAAERGESIAESPLLHHQPEICAYNSVIGGVISRCQDADGPRIYSLFPSRKEIYPQHRSTITEDMEPLPPELAAQAWPNCCDPIEVDWLADYSRDEDEA